MKVSFDTDHARAMSDTRHWAALALSADEKHSVNDPAGNGAAVRCAADRARRVAVDRVSSDPEEHVERIKPYLDMGFTAPRLPCSRGPDQERFLRLYGDEILPRLRKTFG